MKYILGTLFAIEIIFNIAQFEYTDKLRLITSSSAVSFYGEDNATQLTRILCLP